MLHSLKGCATRDICQVKKEAKAEARFPNSCYRTLPSGKPFINKGLRKTPLGRIGKKRQVLARTGKYWQEPASTGKSRQVLARNGKSFDPSTPRQARGRQARGRQAHDRQRQQREAGSGNREPGAGSREGGTGNRRLEADGGADRCFSVRPVAVAYDFVQRRPHGPAGKRRMRICRAEAC